MADDAVEAANREAVQRMHTAEPVLIDVVPAREVIPALSEGRTILHAKLDADWVVLSACNTAAAAGAGAEVAPSSMPVAEHCW